MWKRSGPKAIAEHQLLLDEHRRQDVTTIRQTLTAHLSTSRAVSQEHIQELAKAGNKIN